MRWEEKDHHNDDSHSKDDHDKDDHHKDNHNKDKFNQDLFLCALFFHEFLVIVVLSTHVKWRGALPYAQLFVTKSVGG